MPIVIESRRVQPNIVTRALRFVTVRRVRPLIVTRLMKDEKSP